MEQMISPSDNSKKNKESIVTEIISSLFILLFVYTAVSKLLEHEKFVAVLSASPLIGSFAIFVSWFLPITELIIAALLFFPTSRKTGLKLAAGLMIFFTIYIGYMIAFTPNLPCSCGGVLEQLSWKGHLLFNLLFTLLAFIGLYPHKLFIAINPVLSRAPARQAGKAENLYKQ
jgi:hypothetical protein